MGIFYDESEEDKKYRLLVRAIRTNISNITDEDRNYLASYVTKIKEGRIVNDFFDFDLLNEVILNYVNNEFDEYIEASEFIKKIVSTLNLYLPEGKETPNYNAIRTYLSKNKFALSIDAKVRSLFSDLYSYLTIENIISSNELYIKYKKIIYDYALRISPYCINETVLKNEILSFINGLNDELGDILEYSEFKVTEAKKRCGIYPIDEKTLAMISKEAITARQLIEQLNNMQFKLDEYLKTIRHEVGLGIKHIDEQSKLKVEGIQLDIDRAKKEITDELDSYLKTLETNLKQSSDTVFNAVLEEAQSKIRSLRLAAQNLSSTTTTELLRVKASANDAVDKLKDYVDNEPKLRELIESTVVDDKLKEALLSMKDNVSGNVPLINERIVLPANSSIIVPSDENISYKLIDAFDETIPFDERFGKIMELKSINEKKGIIYHSMIDEIIKCIMEGDWVYIYGPTGCGKSHIIKQASELLSLDFVENGKITDKYSIMAYNDPHGRFRATPAFISLVYGKLLILDEFDNGNTDTEVVLNELYSGLLDTLERPDRDRFVTFAEDMRVKVNPNFRMVSAGNTNGEGENELFSARGRIDESVLERMTPKLFKYDSEVERKIFGRYSDWYKLFINFREICEKYADRESLCYAPGMITTRDASAIVKYIKHNSKSVDQIMREKFTQTKNDGYLAFIANELKERYGFNEDEIVDTSSAKLSDVDEITLARKLYTNCRR